MESSVGESQKITVEEKIHGTPVKDTGPGALRELLEKNLKWSQIIYEQNRRINSKMTWSLVANWLRLIIILVPIILAILLVLNVIHGVKSNYSFLLPSQSSTTGSTTSSAESLNAVLNSLPLDAAQKAELKALLK
jgi:hypothetical protein